MDLNIIIFSKEKASKTELSNLNKPCGFFKERPLHFYDYYNKCKILWLRLQ